MRTILDEGNPNALTDRLKTIGAARAQKFTAGQRVLWAQGMNVPCKIIERLDDDTCRVEFATPRREFDGQKVVRLGAEALRPDRQAKETT